MGRWCTPTLLNRPLSAAYLRERFNVNTKHLCIGLTAAVATGFASITPAFAAGGADVEPWVYQIMVFVIAIFVGYYVVWSVTPALHTPLMSVTNAVSSVIVVGALLAVGISGVASTGSVAAKVFGFLALVMASVNIFGGFLVTSRMLAMYKKKEPKR